MHKVQKPISRVTVRQGGIIPAIRIGNGGPRTHLAAGRYVSEGVYQNGMHLRGEGGDLYLLNEKDLLQAPSRSRRLYRAVPKPFKLPQLSDEQRQRLHTLFPILTELSRVGIPVAPMEEEYDPEFEAFIHVTGGQHLQQRPASPEEMTMPSPTALTGRFSILKLKTPVGQIRAPQQPIRWNDGDFIDHLTFDWNSMGGPFTLCELKVRKGLSVAAIWDELDGYRLAALIEPDVPDLWAAYYRQVFLTNGAAYGFGVFGSLPCVITNYKPDLLSDDLLREAIWDTFRVMAAEDEAAFNDSIGDIFERMPPLDRECQLELLDEVRQYPHREDCRGGDGTSRMELRWLFDWYWKQAYRGHR